MVGRPEKLIDWKLLDLMLEGGSNGREIAAKFDMHPDSLYDKVQKEYGINFSEYAESKNYQGKGNLKTTMYMKALKGNDKMLLHLAKHLLGQWDRLDTTQINSETNSQMLALLAQLQSMQQNTETTQIDLNNCETNNSVETQS